MSTKGITKGYVPDRTRKIARRRNTANALTALVCTAAVGVVFSGHLIYKSYYSVGWHTHSEGTYYISPETNERVTGYQIIDNVCYLFDDEGLILSPGWQEFRGDKYYLGKDGIIQRGVTVVDGVKYYLSTESGVFRTGLVNINGDEYYFDEHGFPGSGITGNSYFDENGKQRRGWVNVGGAQYYFKNDGTMTKGFLEIEGNVFYFDKEGKMATDWKVLNGSKYLFNENGVMHRGWIEKDGKYYYADDETGACVKGFHKVDGNTYYFDSNSEMVKGWKTIEGERYYFSTDGVMTTGWYEDDDHTGKYYFNENGQAAHGFTVIDDENYYFDDDCRLMDGWQEIDGKRYYFGRGGNVAEGWTELASGETDPETEEPIYLRYYFYPDTHEAAYGWASIGSSPGEVKMFKADMADYEKLSKKSDADMTSEERTRLYELNEKYRDGTMERYQKDIYDQFGAEVLGDYYFYSDNTLAYGWIEVAGYRFHFDEDTGKKSTGWQTIDGDRYNFGETGAACTGEFTESQDESYLFSYDGVLSDGLVRLNGTTRYKKGDADWVKGEFRTEKGKTYYFDDDGYAVTGWTEIEGRKYFFDDEGVMTKGIYNDGTDIYYITDTGEAVLTWVTLENEKTYYFGTDGKAYKGWKKISDIEYYFGEDGTLQQGWTEIEGKRYYLENGVMLRGPVYIGDEGELINLGENGYVTEGWLTWAGDKYYNLKGGIAAIGWQEIEGKQYYFDWEGILMTDTEIDGVILGPDGAAE